MSAYPARILVVTSCLSAGGIQETKFRYFGGTDCPSSPWLICRWILRSVLPHKYFVISKTFIRFELIRFPYYPTR